MKSVHSYTNSIGFIQKELKHIISPFSKNAPIIGHKQNLVPLNIKSINNTQISSKIKEDSIILDNLSNNITKPLIIKHKNFRIRSYSRTREQPKTPDCIKNKCFSPIPTTSLFSNEKIKNLIEIPGSKFTKNVIVEPMKNPEKLITDFRKTSSKILHNPINIIKQKLQISTQTISKNTAKTRLKAVTELLFKKRVSQPDIRTEQENKNCRRIPRITPLPFVNISPTNSSKKIKPIIGWGQVELKWKVDSQGLPAQKRPKTRENAPKGFSRHFLNIRRIGSISGPEENNSKIQDEKNTNPYIKNFRHKSAYSLDSSSPNSPQKLSKRSSSIKRRTKKGSARLNETNIGSEERDGKWYPIIATPNCEGREIAVNTNETDTNSKNLYFNLSVNFSKVRFKRGKTNYSKHRKASYCL